MLRQLLAELRKKQQRIMLRLRGTQTWAHKWLTQELNLVLDKEPELQVIRFIEHPDKTKPINQIHDYRLKQYQKLLGQECDLLVFDAYAGFNPDALGALTGTIRAGGLCILITPEDEDWCDYIDPESQRFCIEPFKPEQLTRRYIHRLCQKLSNNDAIVSVTERNSELVDITNLDMASANFIHDNLSYGCLNRQQLTAVQKIVSLSAGTVSGVLVLTADRGRGKSAALGLAAAQLMVTSSKSSDSSSIKILISSPSPDSTATVFKHLCEQLDSEQISYKSNANTVLTSHSELSFIAPDELSLTLPDADMIFVDEAAAIPQQMLSPVINHYQRLVFATTVHGYEGTGRGFEYKLKPLLKSSFVNYQELELEQPIRFAQNDKLEPLVNGLLGLDIELPEVNSPNVITLESLKFERLELNHHQESFLQFEKVFGLLVNAHYRTTPSDFRYMLDGPNLQLFTLKHGQQLVAASLVAYEGKLAPELNQEIWQGRRRPRGHLLPQSLMAHAGFVEAGEYSYARVIRIAVHPKLQLKGIGSLMLKRLEEVLRSDGIDILCTSFGASNSLIRFWRKSGLDFARLGVKAEASTGEYSAMMMKPLSLEHVEWCKKVTDRFYQNLQIENKLKLRSNLTVDLPLVGNVLNNDAVSEQDISDVTCFAHHHRTLDTCIAALYRFHNKVKAEIETPKLTLLIASDVDRKKVNATFRLSGEKNLVAALRAEALNMLSE